MTVTYGKRGRRRKIPLAEQALDVIAAWVRARPVTEREELLLSLRRTRTRRPLAPPTVRDINRIVGRHRGRRPA
jgi:site-specific recombinase XerC